MIKINCSDMSCALRGKCRVIHKTGTMKPNLFQSFDQKITFICGSKKITRGKKKPSTDINDRNARTSSTKDVRLPYQDN